MYLAGLDGYDGIKEYYKEGIALSKNLTYMNSLIKSEIDLMSNRINIHYVTDSKYDNKE